MLPEKDDYHIQNSSQSYQYDSKVLGAEENFSGTRLA